MKNILNGKTFLFAAFVLIAASVIYSNYVTSQANVGIELTDHLKGAETPVATLTEYSDFQCPACAQFYPVVKDILEDYGDQLQLEYKHFPLISIHPYAVPAAKAAEAAAQQGKFWEMHDKLFENQAAWSAAANPRVHFDQYAEEIGLDLAQFKKQYKASLIEDRVQEQYEEARELGLTGTPSFFLNGEKLEFGTLDEFIEKIEAALGIEPEVQGIEVTGAESITAGEAEVRFGF